MSTVENNSGGKRGFLNIDSGLSVEAQLLIESAFIACMVFLLPSQGFTSFGLVQTCNTAKKNFIYCMQLTCSMLQPSFHSNSTCLPSQLGSPQPVVLVKVLVTCIQCIPETNCNVSGVLLACFGKAFPSFRGDVMVLEYSGDPIFVWELLYSSLNSSQSLFKFYICLYLILFIVYVLNQCFLRYLARNLRYIYILSRRRRSRLMLEEQEILLEADLKSCSNKIKDGKFMLWSLGIMVSTRSYKGIRTHSEVDCLHLSKNVLEASGHSSGWGVRINIEVHAAQDTESHFFHVVFIHFSLFIINVLFVPHFSHFYLVYLSAMTRVNKIISFHHTVPRSWHFSPNSESSLLWHLSPIECSYWCFSDIKSAFYIFMKNTFRLFRHKLNNSYVTWRLLTKVLHWRRVYSHLAWLRRNFASLKFISACKLPQCDDVYITSSEGLFCKTWASSVVIDGLTIDARKGRENLRGDSFTREMCGGHVGEIKGKGDGIVRGSMRVLWKREKQKNEGELETKRIRKCGVEIGREKTDGTDMMVHLGDDGQRIKGKWQVDGDIMNL
ncbi:hypothetical protein VP01_17g2 [Puccinia sorghi]|uniref:Uncharacterized protein n=1 Tax=Puccinia sorghi TaxID=27349 RepID=A0A0L6VG67_9BASI|nr:hypothetical protein VP01_17g2 [Puccinia sorghi]